MKRKLALLLALAMLVVLFAGCAKTPDSNPDPTQTPAPTDTVDTTDTPDVDDTPGYNYAKGKYEVNEKGFPTAPYEYTMPLTENNETFSLWTICWTPQYIPEAGFGSMEYPTYLAEHTGVNIEYVLTNAQNRQENFAVLIASDSLCDIMAGGYSYYSGTVRNAIEDGWFVNLYDYKDYMPNYVYEATSRDNVDTYARVFYADDIIPCFYTMYPDPVPANGYLCRKDWCDKLGLKVEEIDTFDEVHDMLVGFKSLGAESPMEIYKTIEIGVGIAFPGFNTTAYANPYGLPFARAIDGNVEFTTTTEDDRDCMQLIHDWFSEGLIDKNWASYGNNTEMGNVFTTSKTGYCNFNPGEIRDIELQTDDPNATWQAVPKTKKTEDQVLKYGQSVTEFCYGSWCFSAKCSNIPLVVTYTDWFYSPEGTIIGSYGVPEFSWNYDSNGNITLTDIITNNPDGIGSAWCLQGMFALNSLADAGMEIIARKYAFEGGERFQAMHLTWLVEDYKGEYDYPTSISFSDEQSDELNLYKNEIMTYINENYLAFVDGSKPMSEWDSYIAGLEGMGIGRCREIYQEAYDAFKVRFADMM